MNRRTFLKTAGFSALAIALGVKVVAMARHYPLEQLLLQLKRLPAEKLSSSGQWSVSEILQHLAQSVRYSRLGYPAVKSALFQHTAGSAALNAFAALGDMHHPLDEPIPGAPVLSAEVPNDVALAELITELEMFIAWQGELAPHFAYGRLSKQQYYSAHYLHIQDHLSELSLS
uniref:Twin-arginine translocation pathway signal n=1 Tax=Rheinheimera sp. BAL341 TaxID=1708203 RepID=A0A486XIB6_9GAMM